MSHNAGALNYGSAALYNIQSAAAYNGSSYYSCYIVNGGAQCSSQNNTGGVIQSMSIVPTGSIPANSLISFDLSIANDNGQIQYYGFAPVRGYFYKVSENFEYNNTNMNLTSHIVLYTYQAVSEFGIDTILASVNGNSWIDISRLSVVVLQGQVDNTSTLNDIARDTGLIKDAIENQNQEEQDAVQDASDAAQDSADGAQSDSEAATSSLLSVITGFFGAMANLNPTNCKFDSHLPFLRGNGEIDLCQVPAPPIVQTIGSLILIGIMVPFAIHMYNRFISITGSFQR